MRQPRSPRPLETVLAQLEPAARTRLEHFRAAIVEHPRLLQIEQELLHAIWEPAGFAHVSVVGPTGVGKSTVLKHLVKHWREQASQEAGPLLVMETWPGGPAFDRTHYYRTGLRLLGEGAWLGVEANEALAKPGRKAAHFQESPELRLAYQAALARHGVRAVLLDEAAHLMKVGASGKLLDQLDWLKSMTNATGIVHLLFGPYTLLAFRNLSGQAARRGLNVHFARYQLQQAQDQRDFQGTLWSLLAEVPVPTHPEALMQHWLTFYERTIGCIGVLRDWLLRASATALRSGREELTWEWLLAHALPVAECDRLAMEATDGEHQLGYTNWATPNSSANTCGSSCKRGWRRRHLHQRLLPHLLIKERLMLPRRTWSQRLGQLKAARPNQRQNVGARLVLFPMTPWPSRRLTQQKANHHPSRSGAGAKPERRN